MEIREATELSESSKTPFMIFCCYIVFRGMDEKETIDRWDYFFFVPLHILFMLRYAIPQMIIIEAEKWKKRKQKCKHLWNSFAYLPFSSPFSCLISKNLHTFLRCLYSLPCLVLITCWISFCMIALMPLSFLPYEKLIIEMENRFWCRF